MAIWYVQPLLEISAVRYAGKKARRMSQDALVADIERRVVRFANLEE